MLSRLREQDASLIERAKPRDDATFLRGSYIRP